MKGGQKLEVGQSVKIIVTNEKQGYKKTGVISLITKHYIQVQFKAYKECYNKVDIFPNGPVELYVKENKNWIRVIGSVNE